MPPAARRIIGGLAASAVAASLVPALVVTTADAETDSPLFHRTATYPVYKNLPASEAAESATVAEISDVSADGRTLIYTDAVGKRIGFLDISDPANPSGEGSLSLATLGDAEDEPTSVAVVGKYVLVVVNTSESYLNPSGRVDVVRISDSKLIRSIELGGQPDSIDISPDGAYAAIAIENERDEDATPPGGSEGDLPQLPAGFVQVLDLDGAVADWELNRVDLVAQDGAALPSFTAAGITEPTDPEPEYVAINSANKLAVTLQENNGIVVIDLSTRSIDTVFSAGAVSFRGADTKNDGIISLTDSISNVVREPDSIAWIDDTHVATANEGDWKGGSRGWSIFDATTGAVAWDAGNTIEKLAVKYGLHIESRANKKGPEIEGLAVATIDGTRYAFVGSERSNFVAVYDLTDATDPAFVQILPTTNGPEGILPIPGRELLAVSSETDDASAGVRSSVSLFQLGGGDSTEFPTIESADVDGSPIGWTALGALSAKPGDAGAIYAASDSAQKPSTVFTVDVTKTPALIEEAMVITQDDTPVNLDVEGIFARPQGGFWLANEGATGAANKLYRTDDDGAIEETVALPTEVTDHVNKWGLEGVTATTDADGEHVFVAVQRPLWQVGTDPTQGDLEGDDVTRIGRYDVSDGSWHWFGYPLSAAKRDGSDWVGLSEIVAVDNDTLAVIERDKLNGPAARNKRIYTVDLPTADPVDVPVLEKRLAFDVLPSLRATNGWTQEKLEGLTIGADGQVYAVTDNDGLKDATGETVFLRLGTAATVFDDELASTTVLSAPSDLVFGASGTATVQVTAAGGSLGGTVVLKDGASVIATKPVGSGAVTFPLKGLSVGTHSLTAVYGGSATSAGSSSVAVPVTVSKAATSTVIRSSSTSVKRGKPVKIAVWVTAAGFTPTGTVALKDGSRTVANVRLSGGKGAVKLTLRSKGLHRLRAVYSGSGQTLVSTSPVLTVRVR